MVSHIGVGAVQSPASSQPALQVWFVRSQYCPEGQSEGAKQPTHCPVLVSHTGPPGSLAQSVLPLHPVGASLPASAAAVPPLPPVAPMPPEPPPPVAEEPPVAESFPASLPLLPPPPPVPDGELLAPLEHATAAPNATTTESPRPQLLMAITEQE